MVQATAYIRVTTRSGTEHELKVDVEGDVSQTDPNPYAVDVDNVRLYSPMTGRPVGQRILAAIKPQMNNLHTLLVEADSCY